MATILRLASSVAVVALLVVGRPLPTRGQELQGNVNEQAEHALSQLLDEIPSYIFAFCSLTGTSRNLGCRDPRPGASGQTLVRNVGLVASSVPSGRNRSLIPAFHRYGRLILSGSCLWHQARPSAQRRSRQVGERRGGCVNPCYLPPSATFDAQGSPCHARAERQGVPRWCLCERQEL